MPVTLSPSLISFRLLTCHFTTEAKLSGPSELSFDLTSNKTHILLSMGPSGPTEAEPLSYHTADRVSSSSGIRFDRFVMVEPMEPRSNHLIKAHGILGIIAWMACAPVGMLFAR